MKILYICADDLTKNRGATVHTLEVADNLKRLGADVTVLALSFGRVEKEGLDIGYIPAIDIEILRPISYRIALFIILFWKLLIRRIDIIYLREISLCLLPFILGKVFRRPIVIEINDADVDSSIKRPVRMLTGVKNFARKVSFKLTDRIIAANREVRDILSKRYSIDNKKFVIIPMGVNTELFRPLDKNECRHLVGLDIKYRYVGFIGALYHFQALEYLVEAALLILREKRDIKFLIVGGGAEEENVKGLARDKGVAENFIFEGEKEYNIIPYYVNSCDLCVSLLKKERGETFSFPLKIYEYLACGRPVVIGNLENENELLNRSATPVLDPSDTLLLSKTIIKMLEESDSLAGECGRLRDLIAEKYSWEKTAENTLRLFEELTA